MIFDIDGVIRAKGRTDSLILDNQIQLLRDGMLLCACTARGESIREAYQMPMLSLMKEQGLKPEALALYCASRNAAIIEKISEEEIISQHPLSFELSQAVLNHPLIQALAALTPNKTKEEWKELNIRIQKNKGIDPDCHMADYPSVFLDKHSNGSQYKLTMYYDAVLVEDSLEKEPAKSLLAYCKNELPPNARSMAQHVKAVLAADDIVVNVDASSSEPHIDLTVEGIGKGVEFKVIRELVKTRFNLKEELVDRYIITLGDSPEGNDSPLLRCGIGVTNINYFAEKGLIVLDVKNLGDQIARARFYFLGLKHIDNTPEFLACLEFNRRIALKERAW